MPARSKSQQRLMAQAYQVRKFRDTHGKEGIDPKDINPEYREEISDIATGMKDNKSALKKFASTKHKGLKDRVGESIEKINAPGLDKIHPYLDPDSKEGNKNEYKKLQNLVDYREFLKNKK